MINRTILTPVCSPLWTFLENAVEELHYKIFERHLLNTNPEDYYAHKTLLSK